MNSKWIWYDLDNDDTMKQEGGCYAMYMDGVLVYVGQSGNVKKRFIGHKINCSRYSNWVDTPWGKCRQFHWKIKYYAKYGKWAMQEMRLIRRLKPKFNQIGVGRRGNV